MNDLSINADHHHDGCTERCFNNFAEASEANNADIISRGCI